jgi:hypothetical protein
MNRQVPWIITSTMLFALPDGRRQQRDEQRRYQRERQYLEVARRSSDAEQARSGGWQRKREQRSPGGLRDETSRSEQHGKHRPHLREVLLVPLVPDETAIRTLRFKRLVDGPAQHPTTCLGRADRRSELRHRWIAENGATGEHEEQRQADREPPPCFEPRLVPEHR